MSVATPVVPHCCLTSDLDRLYGECMNKTLTADQLTAKIAARRSAPGYQARIEMRAAVATEMGLGAGNPKVVREANRRLRAAA